MIGTIFNIQRFCTDDGPGIRTTVFFKGCNLRCLWCHNPESQNKNPEQMFFRDKCIGCGRCVGQEQNPDFKCFQDARELCGKELSEDEVLEEALRDKTFYEHSGGGVTFSGGECMLQIDFLEKLLRACKEQGVHTTVDTAGNVPFSYFKRILPFTDLFLYDVKCFDGEKHRHYTGVDNRLILDNLKNLLTLGKRVWVRIPVIGSVNDSEAEMQKIKDFLASCGTPEKVDLLPYHALGENKYTALGIKAHTFTTPSEDKMSLLRSIFQ
ncbi:MAG: glycyl-radical enzyme activating protein [Clostridia bacterium]|nr:glycyl-radical enzyme activating protein [Clostridia bacterium]